MTNATWLIQTYEMTDEDTQASALDLLSNTPGLTVEARTGEPSGWFIAVECIDASKALNLYEMIMMVDSHAELIHSSTGPAHERETV
jgi:hypothetical protein